MSLSNLLWREFRSTYRWLLTFSNTTSARSRGQYRGQMRRNRVWAAVFNWLWGRNVG